MKHYTPQLSQSMSDTFKLKGESTDEVADYITPVVGINPAVNIIKKNELLNATGATIYTTPTDKDFYLLAAILSYEKDVTSTSTSYNINATINGVFVPIITMRTLTLTAGRGSETLNMPIPIKIDRGVTITVTSSTNVANTAAAGTIIGFTVD